MITRDMNDELLLVMLFLGLRFLLGSFVFSGASKALPSPKAGTETAVRDVGPSLREVPWPSPSLLSLTSWEERPSFGCSAMLGERVVVEARRKKAGGGARTSKLSNDTRVPAVAG